MSNQIYAKLIIEEGVEAGRVYRISEREFFIGREPGSDLVIPSLSISRRHARIYQRDGKLYLEDLASSNGTYLNGERVTKPIVIKPGDKLHIGKIVSLQVQSPSSSQATQVDEDIALVTRADGQSLPAPPGESESIYKTADADESPQEVPAMRGVAETQLGSEPGLPSLPPPQLLVSVAGGESQIVLLDRTNMTLGRGHESDIVLPSKIVSRRHAVIEKKADQYLFRVLSDVANPVFLDGQPLQSAHSLHHGDLLRIGSHDPGLMVTMTLHWPAEEALRQETRSFEFSKQNRLQLGRDPSNDVVLDAPTISRYHTLVEKVGQRFRVRDLDSSNGTFINNAPIEGEVWVADGDILQIGPYRFILHATALAQETQAGGMLVEAINLNKWVRKDLNLLQDISLLFQPREFIVVVGQSGGGKSTLLDAIAGFRPATDGIVQVNETNIYQNFDAIRNEIGFVPQKDIIHMELTAYQALDYAAQLRMPADTSTTERHERVIQVLDDLDLTHRKDVQISGLSGGQQKRVSIGVELLTKPGLFFLDEPTSGLDPGTETVLMHLMRRLADQGRTIILVTHATKNVVLADKVVFLARGGYLAWFGPPDEALAFFDQYREERDRQTGAMEFDEIYAILDNLEKGSGEDWADRYKQNPAYQTYIVEPLHALGHSLGSAPSAPIANPTAKTVAAPPLRRTSWLRQLKILSSRNLKILSRDRASLILMLASAPIVAMLDVVLAFILGRNLYSFSEGDMANAITSLFQPVIFAIMVGGLAQMREFVKESDIYRRERLVNLKVFPYVMSKVWVAALLALYQAAAYTIIHYLAFDMPGGILEFILLYITLVLATMAGMMLGLFASAIAPNANAAPLIVILLIIPQVVLGGALIPVPEYVSTPTSSRWAFESAMAITGIGSDVAADLCWQLPEELRNDMTLDDKAKLNCRCTGLKTLQEETCNFPGLGEFYDPVIDEPQPEEPAALGDAPAEPEIPPPPEEPTDKTDQVAIAQYLQSLEQYQNEVERIRDDYRQQVETYRAQADVFAAEMISYQEERARWEIGRNAAVGKAEAVIFTFNDNFGWSFVDKDDQAAYWTRLGVTWGSQLAIIGILFFAILFAISRKDRSL